MPEKTELINNLVEAWNLAKRTPTIDELKSVAIHLRAITANSKRGQFSVDYAHSNVSEIINAILEYDKPVYDESGAHVLPEAIIAALEYKKQRLIDTKEWTVPVGGEEISPAMQKQREVEAVRLGKKEFESKKLYPYGSVIPKWMHLESKQLFAKILNGELVLIGQMDGDNGMIFYADCSVDESRGALKSKPASVESCSIALTVGKISKTLKINAVTDNFLIKKNSLLSFIKTDFDIVDSTEDTLSKQKLVDYIETSNVYKNNDFIYIEKVRMVGGIQPRDKQIAYEPIMSVKGPTFNKNAMRDAGRVFMFEIMFGTSGKASQIVKRNLQVITKVFTSPKDIRIRKIMETVVIQGENLLKRRAEEQFLKTKTILDDAEFMEGMNEVRWIIINNADAIFTIIDKSSMPEQDKLILKDNVETIKRQEISLSDIIEMTFSDSVSTKSERFTSPFKHKSLYCTREER